MPPQSVVVVDAFSDRPFAGNPAAICVMDAPAAEGWMRNVAREMNLSETAFLHPEGDGYRLRWLTPTVEVDLCGHATLAAAHVLWETGRLAAGADARFQTRSGLLTARRDGSLIVLDFPARPATPCPAPAGLLEALGASEVRHVGKSADDYLVELESEAAVRATVPDHMALARLPVRGVIITSRAAVAPAADTAGPFDFVSRFFAPGSGIAEDPVTGSAHASLGPYWSVRLGKTDMVGHQVSARGGVVRVGVRGDRVLLAGAAVTVLRGEISAPPPPGQG